MEMKKHDWICGDKFRDMADFTFAPGYKHEGDYDNLVNTFDKDKLKEVNVVYTHTMYVDDLFESIWDISKKFIVITHNSDDSIGGDVGMITNVATTNGQAKSMIYLDFPDNIIKWFTKNVNIAHPRIESIPIGVQNDRWLTRFDKKKMIEDKLKEPCNFRNLAYMNFRIGTNADKRQSVYDLLKNKPWITTLQGQDGHDVAGYIDSIYNHKFVICPEGNGMDTHRTWETLYLGSIPVEKRNINNQFYKNLPICFVDDWEEVTEEFLNKKYFDIMAETDWEETEKILQFEYWKNKILATK